MRNLKYTTQLTQGTGIVDETLALLSIYEENMDKMRLFEVARDKDILSFNTERRLKNLVTEAFYPRFVKPNPNIPLWLYRARKRGLSLDEIKQLFMVYCARENAVFFDGVTKVLNEVKAKGESVLQPSTMLDFVKMIIDSGQASWSEIIQKRNSSYVRSTMFDFDMIDRRGNILPYEISDFALMYLMYEAHFDGQSDMSIWNMEEWQLFNLSSNDVLERIMSLSFRGAYVAQSSGDLLTISWNYKSMEEFIDATI